MNRGAYIHQQPNWPNFIWSNERLITLLGKVRNAQGRLIGKMENLGVDLQNEATLESLTLEVVKSTEIEGEHLNLNQVRSSIAKRLGMDIGGLVPVDRNVEGMVDMVLDAIEKYQEPLTKDRLFNWHYALFPTGRSGMYKISVGKWRDDSNGPMQVVSGAMGKEKVHFEAPPASGIEGEMQQFLNWFNNERSIDSILKAGVAHIWFVTIHPFEDGNGRITRTITDMLLTRSDGVRHRFYSMSAQIRKERKGYYEILEKTQKSTLDITDWLEWFLQCLFNALSESDTVLSKILFKHSFWTRNAQVDLNERQIKVMGRLLDDFFGNLTTKKWAKIAKCSSDTALRDIQDLLKKGILVKDNAGGRSTNYLLKPIE